MDKKSETTKTPRVDNVFERFLASALATILTIIFSWRLLSLDGDDDDETKRRVKRPEEKTNRPSTDAAIVVPPGALTQISNEVTKAADSGLQQQRGYVARQTSTRTTTGAPHLDYKGIIQPKRFGEDDIESTSPVRIFARAAAAGRRGDGDYTIDGDTFEGGRTITACSDFERPYYYDELGDTDVFTPHRDTVVYHRGVKGVIVVEGKK